MTVPNVEPTVEQQQQQQLQPQQHQQQQEHNHTKRDYKKKPSITKHKRGGGDSRYGDEFSRYPSYKELPRFTVPSYVYYYPPPMYYPPSFDAINNTINPAMSTSNNVATHNDEDLEIILHEEETITSSVNKRSSDQSKAPLDLKRQLEFYFSRQNLVNDTFLVSQMDSDLYVPISLVANFRRVREWTTDMDTIVTTLKESTAVTVDESGTRVKPNISVERNTVIWRDVPECTTEEIIDLLKELNSPPVLSIKQDIGNMWYFTFESESDALKLLLSVRGKSFKDQAIAARMKSEPLIRVQSRPSAATNLPLSKMKKQDNQETIIKPQQPLIPDQYNLNGGRYVYPSIGYRNTYINTRRNNNYQSTNTGTYNYNQATGSHQTNTISPRGGYKSKNYFGNRNTLETSMSNLSISDKEKPPQRQQYHQRNHYHKKNTFHQQDKREESSKKTESYKSKRRGNHGNEGNSNNQNGGDKNTNRKRKGKSTLNEQKEPNFPPLPNQISDAISSSSAPPTRSAAEIVKSNANAPLKKTEQTPPLGSTTKVSENEAFPSLCQTTEFKSTPFSYADMLKKGEQ